MARTSVLELVVAAMVEDPDKWWTMLELATQLRASYEAVRIALKQGGERFRANRPKGRGKRPGAVLWRLRKPNDPPDAKPEEPPATGVAWPKTALAALAERDALMAAVERLARDTDAANRRFLAAVERILGRLITGPLDDEDDEEQAA